MQPKSTEEIMAEFLADPIECGVGSHTSKNQSWLRSALAEHLLWAADSIQNRKTRVAEHFIDHEQYLIGYKDGNDDFLSQLKSLAHQIHK